MMMTIELTPGIAYAMLTTFIIVVGIVFCYLDNRNDLRARTKK